MLLKVCIFIASIAVYACALSQSHLDKKEQIKKLLGEGPSACYTQWVGDRHCDKACNNKLHSYDGGDCSMRFQESNEIDEGFDIKLNKDFKVVVPQGADAPPPPFSQIGPTVRQGQSFTLKCKNLHRCKSMVMNEISFVPMGKWLSTTYKEKGKTTMVLKIGSLGLRVTT